MKLKFRHVFDVARILKISGMKEEIKAIAISKNSGDVVSVGVDLFYTILSTLADKGGEGALYKLLADIAGRTPEEISDLSLDEVKEMFIKIAEENSLKPFFTLVSKEMKKT